MAPTKDSGPIKFAIVSVDAAVFSIRDGALVVRLIRTNRPPHFLNAPALPGGLVLPKETAEETALRIIRDKAQISASKVYTEQLSTFSAVDRDPRGRVVAVAYLSLVPWESLSVEERNDTDETFWKPVRQATKLAYDHDDILAAAVARLRSRVTYTTLLSKLMPEEFTLTELEQAYECILKTDLDKRNFRKKVLKLGIVKPLGRKRSLGRARPAELYAFTSSKVREIEVL